MSTQSTTTVIGTKPMAALVAEWREHVDQQRKMERRLPVGEGWVEVSAIMCALDMRRGTFYPFIKAQIDAGCAERFTGYAERKKTVWYRIIKPAAAAKPKSATSRPLKRS